MICPRLVKKFDYKISHLESLNKELMKENKRIKRIVDSVVKEWELEGVVDVDVLKKIIEK